MNRINRIGEKGGRKLVKLRGFEKISPKEEPIRELEIMFKLARPIYEIWSRMRASISELSKEEMLRLLLDVSKRREGQGLPRFLEDIRKIYALWLHDVVGLNKDIPTMASESGSNLTQIALTHHNPHVPMLIRIKHISESLAYLQLGRGTQDSLRSATEKGSEIVIDRFIRIELEKGRDIADITNDILRVSKIPNRLYDKTNEWVKMEVLTLSQIILEGT